jgi:DNA-binding HxlR family transcriptional regulator
VVAGGSAQPVVGARSFRDFQAAPEKIATNILANRLQRLKDAGTE